MSFDLDPERDGFDFESFDAGTPPVTAYYEPTLVGENVLRFLSSEVMMLPEDEDASYRVDDEGEEGRIFSWYGEVDGIYTSVTIQDREEEMPIVYDDDSEADEVTARVIKAGIIQTAIGKQQAICLESAIRHTQAELEDARMELLMPGVEDDVYVRYQEHEWLLKVLTDSVTQEGLTVRHGFQLEYSMMPHPHEDFANMTISEYVAIDDAQGNLLVCPMSPETDNVDKDTMTLEDLDVVEALVRPLPIDSEVMDALQEIRRNPLDMSSTT